MHAPRHDGATRRPLLALPLALVLLGIAVPAEAQLGGLTRRAQGAAQQRVEQRIEEELPYTRLPAPAFHDRILEINEARLRGVLRGFAEEVEFAGRAGEEYRAQVRAHEVAVREYDAALEAYEAKMEPYTACVDRFNAQEERAQAANQALVEKAIEDMDDEEFAAYIEDLALRGEVMAREIQSGRNDPETQRRHEAYMAEVAKMEAEQARRMELALRGATAERERSSTENARLEAACGPAPVRPASPQSSLTTPEGALAQRGARAAGLTPEQYSIMRERVIYWSQRSGRPTGMGYSDGEMAALGGEKSNIERVVRRMRDARIPL